MAAAATVGNSCELRIQAALTVVPTEPTFSRTSTKLPLPLRTDLNRFSVVSTTAFHVLLLFHKSSSKNSGSIHAALIKESLSRALVSRPILAGRIRHSDDDKSVLEIVPNDSGVRLIETAADITAAEFLAAEGEGGNLAAKLVYWEDLPDQNFQFSPLFYVQVTNFSCGSYAIGFSCSLLLTDPFSAASFLQNWIGIHRDFLSKNDPSSFPLFYHPHFRGPVSASPSSVLRLPASRKPASDTVIFTAVSGGVDDGILAEVCVEEAEREIGRKMTAEYCWLIKGSLKDDEVVIVSRSGTERTKEENGNGNGVVLKRRKTWDEIGLGEVWFSEGEKADYTSCWMSSSVNDQGLVLIFRGDDVNTKAIVLFP